MRFVPRLWRWTQLGGLLRAALFHVASKVRTVWLQLSPPAQRFARSCCAALGRPPWDAERVRWVVARIRMAAIGCKIAALRRNGRWGTHWTEVLLVAPFQKEGRMTIIGVKKFNTNADSLRATGLVVDERKARGSVAQSRAAGASPPSLMASAPITLLGPMGSLRLQRTADYIMLS